MLSDRAIATPFSEVVRDFAEAGARDVGARDVGTLADAGVC
jgi:hypothetical protein